MPGPSYATVRQIVRALDPAPVALALEGLTSYRDKHELVFRRRAESPNQIWQADHTNSMCSSLVQTKSQTGRRRSGRGSERGERDPSPAPPSRSRSPSSRPARAGSRCRCRASSRCPRGVGPARRAKPVPQVGDGRRIGVRRERFDAGVRLAPTILLRSPAPSRRDAAGRLAAGRPRPRLGS